MNYASLAKKYGGGIDYAALAEKAGGVRVEPVEDTPDMTETPDMPEKGFGEKVKEGIFSFLDKTRKSAIARSGQGLGAFKRGYAGGQSSFSSALQVAGATAGFIGDVTGDAIMETAKVVLPEETKESIKQGLATGAEAIQLSKLMEEYGKWAEMHPEASANLESIANIASVLPLPKAAGMASRTAEEAVEIASKTALKAKKIAGEATNITKEAIKETGSKTLVKLSKPLEENVETAIKANRITKNDVDRYFSIAENAKSKTGEITPFEAVGREQLGGALNDLNAKLKIAGKKQSKALKRNAEKIVEVKPSYDNFASKMAERLGTYFDPEGNLATVTGRVSSIIGKSADEGMIKLVKNAMDTLKETPTLQQVNDLVDNLQDALYKVKQVGAIPISGKTEAVVKEFVYNLNKFAKKAGGRRYSSASAEYSRLIKMRDELNTVLGANYKNAGSKIKQIFSPAGGNIKRLVTEIEKETGRNIFDHATIAKATMDILGDPRAKSLLDKIMSIPTSRNGFIDSVLGLAAEKINSPEIMKRKIYDALEKASKKSAK